jgi:hypothetical protein
MIDQQTSALIRDGLQAFARLPAWVLAATDPERVSLALIRNIPEFSLGKLSLHDCRIHHVRYKDGHWTGTYSLSVSDPVNAISLHQDSLLGILTDPEDAKDRPAEIAGSFGVQGWHAYLPEIGLYLEPQEPEKVLAALSQLIDPEGSRRLLETSIRSGSPNYRDIRIQAAIPKITRYKPGSRCTILYHLKYSQADQMQNHWPELVVAKTYRGEKGWNAYQSMRALWDSPLGSSKEVAIAEPLAYLPDLKVLVQGPVREQQTLKELVRAAIVRRTPEMMEELFELMRKSATGVVMLHRSNVTIAPVFTWEARLANVKEQLDDLSESIPALKGAIRPLFERLEWVASAYPAGDLVSSHGTFRPAQVLIDRDQIGFIDFDSFCQSESALDLALFTGNLKSIGLTVSEDDEDEQILDPAEQQARLDGLEAASQVFLETYAASLPISPMRIALWETLDLLTIILHSWTKVKPVRLKNTMFLLEHQLRRSGLLEPGEWPDESR